MLPIPIDIILTTSQNFFLISLATMGVNLKIGYKKILIISAITAFFNVILFTPYVNLWLKVILTMTVIVLLIKIFTKLRLIFSVIITSFSFTFNFLFEAIYLVIYFSYDNIVPTVFISDILINLLGTLFMCTLCLICILTMKVKNFSFLNLDKFIQTHSHLDKSKPIFLLIILIQIVPISFYFINTGFILYGSEILQAIHMDEIISLFTFLTIFFIVLSLSMLYLIKLLDKKIIKNVMSILHGEYVALHEDSVQLIQHRTEKIQQQLQVIKKHVSKKQYNEILLELNQITQIDSYLQVKELLSIQSLALRNFLQNKVYLAQLAKIDFILEVDEDLSGLDYYIEDSLLEMLQELYNNAFEAALKAEFSEVYSKFIREENEFIILINNNGIVLPSTHQYHLFHPQYTTKKAFIHGQGLYKVKKMIEYYQGSIDIRGYDGYTRVTVKLPIPKEYNLLKKGLEPKYRGLKLVKKKGEEKT